MVDCTICSGNCKKQIFVSTVLVVVIIYLGWDYIVVNWHQSTNWRNVLYDHQDFHEPAYKASSIEHHTDRDDLMDNSQYDLMREISFNEYYGNFANSSDVPRPREVFKLSPMDIFNGGNSLCTSISNHDPKLMDSCHKSTSCCITVKFVGMCGKWAKVLRKFPFSVKCSKCVVIVDHVANPVKIADADLVVFTHIGGYMAQSLWDTLLRYKHTNQRWVFSTIESAIYVRGLLPPWSLRNNVYDYSETFLSHSDITTPYGFYQPFRIGQPKRSWNDGDHVKNKNKLLAWTSSHCETSQWDRKRFVLDLGKILPQLDTYGKCGKKSVCKETWNADCVTEFDNLMRTYKFELSLENSCCSEYITEKLWKPLGQGVVPIVVGASLEELNTFAPPRSFIHVDQFTSMKQLADYILYLDKNDTAYSEYFAWKRKGEIHHDSIEEHYKRIVSDEMMCKIAGLWQQMGGAKKGVDTTKRPFDVYSSSWAGTCVTCGQQDWIKRYEYPPEHKRRSSSLWARR